MFILSHTLYFFFFFFNDTATTEIYTLSLHDALPIWHGQVNKALGKIDDLETSIEPFSEIYARFPRLVKALSELRTSIVNNRHMIPNYGERYHNGEAIATGFVESTVNEVVSKRFCKKQQMQWSKEGAHLLLQTRVRTLNGELGAIFKRWYPDMDLEVEEISIAA